MCPCLPVCGGGLGVCVCFRVSALLLLGRARVFPVLWVEIWEPVGEYLELNHGPAYESSSMIAKAL